MKNVLISCATHDAAAYVSACKRHNLHAIVSGEMMKEEEFHGLLLPGGGDIAPFFYQQKNQGSKHLNILEDIIQLMLFDRFKEQKKPILGICKGMQLINVALGGTIQQTLQNEALHRASSIDVYHKTALLPKSTLHSLYASSFGKELLVNSAHHQAIDTLGSNLIAAQYAFDGTIEGIEHSYLPILGTQWHPERMLSGNHAKNHADGDAVFAWFAAKL